MLRTRITTQVCSQILFTSGILHLTPHLNVPGYAIWGILSRTAVLLEIFNKRRVVLVDHLLFEISITTGLLLL